MDRSVPIGATGFPMQPGARYRLLSAISGAAFRVLPWNAPGTDDVAASFAKAGFSNVSLTMPWDSLPADCPHESTQVAGDAFVVRAEGVWTGGAVLSARLSLPRSEHPVEVAEVWLRAAAPSADVPAVPDVPVAPPTPPRPAERPLSPTRPVSPAPAPRLTAPPLPPPLQPRRRGLSTGGKVFLRGGVLAAAAVLIVRAASPLRRSRTA
jgi:hypothetical protein